MAIEGTWHGSFSYMTSCTLYQAGAWPIPYTILLPRYEELRSLTLPYPSLTLTLPFLSLRWVGSGLGLGLGLGSGSRSGSGLGPLPLYLVPYCTPVPERRASRFYRDSRHDDSPLHALSLFPTPIPQPFPRRCLGDCIGGGSQHGVHRRHQRGAAHSTYHSPPAADLAADLMQT